MMDKIKVYLAGKITANWWRDNLIGNLRGFISSRTDYFCNELWFISEMAKKCFVETNLFGRDRSIVEAFNQALAFAKLMII